MDRGHILQSLPMQQMITGSCPNWWNINNMMKPPPNYPQQLLSPSANLLFPPNSMFIPQYMPPSSSSSSSSCHDNQDPFPESWSQLLLGEGAVGEEDKSFMGHNIQDEKLENLEEQILRNQNEVVKQENSTRTYVNGHGNLDNQYQAVTMANWSQTLPVSSPKSSCITNASNLSTDMLDFSNKKMGGKRSAPSVRSSECNSTGTRGPLKKARVQPSSIPSTIKVRKEKLGDRVTALHQLVSPFGKTDTASVLLEAIGYIRFLQNQVEALSLPYLSNGGESKRLQHTETNEEQNKDLRSRGLCLVPLSCTHQVGSDNGADYWAQSLGGGFR